MSVRNSTLAVILLTIAVILVAACGDGEDIGPPASPHATAQTAISQSASPSALASAQPAPASGTPIPARPAEGAYKLTRFLAQADYEFMLGLVPASPEKAILITQTGRLYRLSLDGRAPPALIGDISKKLARASGSEEGLLGIAISPDFAADGTVYLYYTLGSPQPSILSRFRIVDGLIEESSEQILLEIAQPFSNHNGGQLAFGPDGYLYLALGDGGSGGDPRGNGQNLGTLLGKILRLDVSGGKLKIPPDNPFAGRPDARPEIYAYGLRNPWRFTFDRATGQLWASDVGQNRWEEVDRIVAGGNYGWNVLEGFECFQASACETAGMQMPRAVYGREGGCSITGGYVYRGQAMPELDGWYIYGDFCSGKIWALNTAAESDPALLMDTGLPISSFAELPDGEILVITFERALYRIDPAR